MAECHVVHSQIVTDLADHYFTRVEVNAHIKRNAALTAEPDAAAFSKPREEQRTEIPWPLTD
jgi:hypothetical protein